MARIAAGQIPITRQEQIDFAVRVLQREAEAISSLAHNLDESFLEAAEQIYKCSGAVIVSGIGKAGLVGRKISATLASTGTPSHFLHPSEAIHGDLGMLTSRDILLVLSYSGETEELVRVLPCFRRQAARLIAITRHRHSSLGRQSDHVLELGEIREACSLKRAPSSSTAAMMALGDALALLVSHMRGFAADDFARYHPGGNLGRQLMKVEEAMRPLDQCRIARDHLTIREILVSVSRPGRRSGAILLVDDCDRLCGIFTDSDLAKVLEQRRDEVLDRPISEVMTKKFLTVQFGSRLSDAIELLGRYKISELPVTDEFGKATGIIDITDMVGVITEDKAVKEDVPPPRLLKFNPQETESLNDSQGS